MNRNPCITIVGEPVEVLFRVLRTSAASRPEHGGPSDHGSGEEPGGKRPVGNGQGIFLGPAVNEFLDKDLASKLTTLTIGMSVLSLSSSSHTTDEKRVNEIACLSSRSYHAFTSLPLPQKEIRRRQNQVERKAYLKKQQHDTGATDISQSSNMLQMTLLK
ncbi:hypothetical protein F2Q69_00010754 [Brassica cretica]|uniref:Uncharacterized protein n=1 Tax=Brassica cretica TaxID=69181 RepID=A0A8S9QS77_BRACR|nr:hypothetical protein F2Q69_00010754 [Brassica cretica]